MSTTPSDPGGSRPTMAMPGITSGARMPIPGNAEFLALVVIEIFLAILLLDDQWNANDWAFGTVILGAAYLLSRGIAKASRVLEQ